MSLKKDTHTALIALEEMHESVMDDWNEGFLDNDERDVILAEIDGAKKHLWRIQPLIKLLDEGKKKGEIPNG